MAARRVDISFSKKKKTGLDLLVNNTVLYTVQYSIQYSTVYCTVYSTEDELVKLRYTYLKKSKSARLESNDAVLARELLIACESLGNFLQDCIYSSVYTIPYN